MPHISENEVEKLRGLLQLMRHEPEDAKQTAEIAQEAYKILDGIQPAPQSDEVREAINWLSGYVESCKRDPQDRGEQPEIKHIETLTRAAQSAHVDLERVLQPIATCPKDIESRFIQYRERDEYVMIGDYYQSKGYETTHWAPLPTPSKE